MNMDWLKHLRFDADGLIPAIAQDHKTNKVLMVAWMNAQSLEMTVKRKEAVYFSRSRQKLWHKGEESGHTQFANGRAAPRHCLPHRAGGLLFL
jgi:phosphoribosyl-AMP cyclohydrolase